MCVMCQYEAGKGEETSGYTSMFLVMPVEKPPAPCQRNVEEVQGLLLDQKHRIIEGERDRKLLSSLAADYSYAGRVRKMRLLM